jgi:hypothetical protein
MTRTRESMEASSDASRPRTEACPALFVAVRRTLDWDNERHVRENLKPGFRAKYESWNATFRMPYHMFRSRLREIARLNWSRVAEVSVVPLAEVPPGALVAPVDDDDWFAPDLAAGVRESYQPGVRGYHWTCSILDAQRVRRRWFGLLGRPKRRLDAPKFTCETNGYAVVNEDGWRELAGSHSEASRHFDDHSTLVKRIPQVLSVQNKSLASQSVLDWGKPTVDREFLRRRFRRYRGFYGRVALPTSTSWATPYVGLMAELMRDLELA